MSRYAGPQSVFSFFDVFQKKHKKANRHLYIDFGRSPEVNIWTTFRHVVSKDVFSRGTSSLFQLKK